MKPWWIRKPPSITQRPYIIYAIFMYDKYPLHHLQNFSIIIFLVIRKPSPKPAIKKFIIPRTFTKNFPSPSIPQITPNQRYFINVSQIFPLSTNLHKFTPSKLNKEWKPCKFQLESNSSTFEILQTCKRFLPIN